ncbi:MAG: TIGR04084 family radical SAM/SPASM domain-containing protein [Candidatus Lokiarchaeota archaeon]|nr:TIGR04084 family radical SAM/SPASM domain-containing protein [Candidatus Lokiarchaeota archaeon]
MNYHLVLTRRCNLNCEYCHGGEENENTEIKYSLSELETFLSNDTDVQLMLYGGEPTLRIPLILKLMNKFPDARFMLQTNALLLHKIPKEYATRFHSVLVSIDGRKHITDAYRSDGVYDRVIQNAKWLRDIGFQGDVVARMAVSQQSDIFKEVVHLLEIDGSVFDHVHWQLNVVWDAEGNWTDFDKWIETSYNPGITRLVDYWVRKMKKGVIMGIVPFIPLTYSLLTGKESLLRCGSGIDTFAIHVDGSIGICPISPDWEFSIVGDIRKSTPQDLKNCMLVDEPCPSCEEFDICGGRCLFANKQRLWGEEGFEKICTTVKHLIQSIRLRVPEIKELIKNGIISLDELTYPKYNNGCEIIP